MMRAPEKERGTVLLTTLLIMAVMAAVSVAIMDDIRFAVKRVINVGDYAQADWYVKGGEDFAQSYITSSLIPLPDPQKNQLFQRQQVFTFPYEGGLMTLNVRDGTDCFSLGSLVTSDGQADDKGRRQFTSLLVSLGWPQSEANSMAYVLTDWIDRDTQRAPNGAEDGDYLRKDPPYRTANTALQSVMELRSLEGMTEELYESIRPYLCARPAGELTRLNINAAMPIDAHILAALLGGAENFDVALRLITERPANGYEVGAITTETLADEGFEGRDLALDQITYSPEKLWVEVRADYLNATRLMSYEYDMLDNSGANLTYRGWGAESYRPTLETIEDSADNE